MTVATCQSCGRPLASDEAACEACSAEVADDGTAGGPVGPLISLASWNWYTLKTSPEASTNGAPPAPAPVQRATDVTADAAPPVVAPIPPPAAAPVPPPAAAPPVAVAPVPPPPPVAQPVATPVSPAVVAPVPPPATTQFATHFTPATGIQAYPQAYPPYPAKLGPYLSAHQTVQVVEVRGTWAHVFADGQEQGWVEGTQLVPPVGSTIRYAPTARISTAPAASGGQAAFSPGQIVGACGALGMIIGALVTWTQIVSINAFRFPVQFLFDNRTQSHNPRLGWFILLLGALGLAASAVRGVERWRTVVGIFGALIVALFLIQVASGLSGTSIGPFGAHVGFFDVVGGGPFITGIAALALAISPVFD